MLSVKIICPVIFIEKRKFNVKMFDVSRVYSIPLIKAVYLSLIH